MSRRIMLSHDYACSAEKLWNLVISFDALAKVSVGLTRFEGLPEGQAFTGQTVEVMVSLFGKLPPQPYTMKVVVCDAQTMLLQSEEKGAGVKSWNHTLRILKTEAGCNLTDRIEIDAGLLTPLFSMWAKYLYGARHKPRLAMLGLSEQKVL